MTRKVFKVEFPEGVAEFTIVAKTLSDAIRIASRLWRTENIERPVKRENGGVYNWNYYLKKGLSKPIKASLVEELDN